jgi:hypothetical protein
MMLLMSSGLTSTFVTVSLKWKCIALKLISEVKLKSNSVNKIGDEDRQCLCCPNILKNNVPKRCDFKHVRKQEPWPKWTCCNSWTIQVHAKLSTVSKKKVLPWGKCGHHLNFNSIRVNIWFFVWPCIWKDWPQIMLNNARLKFILDTMIRARKQTCFLMKELSFWHYDKIRNYYLDWVKSFKTTNKKWLCNLINLDKYILNEKLGRCFHAWWSGLQRNNMMQRWDDNI